MLIFILFGRSHPLSTFFLFNSTFFFQLYKKLHFQTFIQLLSDDAEQGFHKEKKCWNLLEANELTINALRAWKFVYQIWRKLANWHFSSIFNEILYKQEKWYEKKWDLRGCCWCLKCQQSFPITRRFSPWIYSDSNV